MTTSSTLADREGEGLLPLSALNDLLYCDRRCWLHRVAGLDHDNAHTLSGRLDHGRVDRSERESRPGVRIERAVPLVSRRLGLIGRADVVEFVTVRDGESEHLMIERPYPVEYKHGRRRKWNNDDAQLCAQALCLEEMLHLPVPVGAVFHVRAQRRREVAFTPTLRRLVESTVEQLHRLLQSNAPPPARLKPQCDGCAMRGHCLPEASAAEPRLARQLSVLFRVDEVS